MGSIGLNRPQPLKHKHMLRVARQGYIPRRNSDHVLMVCDNCPKFINLPREMVYDILVRGVPLLEDQTIVDQQRLRSWKVCNPYVGIFSHT